MDGSVSETRFSVAPSWTGAKFQLLTSGRTDGFGLEPMVLAMKKKVSARDSGWEVSCWRGACRGEAWVMPEESARAVAAEKRSWECMLGWWWCCVLGIRYGYELILWAREDTHGVGFHGRNISITHDLLPLPFPVEQQFKPRFAIH